MSTFISTNLSTESNFFTKLNYKEVHSVDNLIFAQKEKRTFDPDMFFGTIDDIFVVFNGVMLNRTELEENFHKDTTTGSLIRSMYVQETEFFNQFRGSFSGALYDAPKKKCIIYTNHYGDNAIFYYKNGNIWAAASDLKGLMALLKANNQKLTFDEKAVQYMLTYGYMADDTTYISEIKRLLPGHYLEITSEGVKDNVYYELKRNKLDLSNVAMEEAIEQIDILFRRAVKREFDKDILYGKRHLVELSGGLDSRMNYWVANDMGYKDILAITFGQADCADERIAKDIVDYWHGEIIVWPMNGAKHLFDLEEIVDTNFGLSIYSGIGSEKRILDSLDMNEFGLLHTGQLGDVVLGTFMHSLEELNDNNADGLYSDLLNSSDSAKSSLLCGNKEERLMIVRGMLGCMSSHFMPRIYTEVASPFLDVDLMDYMLSLPLEWRINHYIYKQWIIKKYPDAANFKWEKIDAYITDSPIKLKIKQLSKMIQWNIRNPKRLLLRLGIIKSAPQAKLIDGMNPLDLWYDNILDIRKYMDEVYKSNVHDSRFSESIQKNIEELYQKGTMGEKLQVLTLLGASKFYSF